MRRFSPAKTQSLGRPLRLSGPLSGRGGIVREKPVPAPPRRGRRIYRPEPFGTPPFDKFRAGSSAAARGEERWRASRLRGARSIRRRSLPHSEQARLRAVSRESRDVIRLPDGVAGSEARRKGPGLVRRAPRRHLPGMFAGPDLGIAHAYVVSEFPSLPVACSFLAHALAVKIVRARIHRSSAYLPIGVRSHTLQVSYIPRARAGRRPLLAAGVALPCSRRSSKSVVPPDPYSKQP